MIMSGPPSGFVFPSDNAKLQHLPAKIKPYHFTHTFTISQVFDNQMQTKDLSFEVIR